MLQIFIMHNIRVRGASGPLRIAVTKELTIANPAYEERRKKRQPTYGIDAKIQLFVYDRGDLIVPRGFRGRLFELLEAQGIDPKKVVTEAVTEGRDVDFGNWTTDPRDYQLDALIALMNAGTNGVLVAPAGAGKTFMGFRYIFNHGKPALWLTHTKDLMYQSQKAARRYMTGVGEIGLLGDGQHKWGDGKLIIATVQTLKANPELVEQLNPLIGTLVIDEAHHFPAPDFIDVAGKFAAQNVLGVTATPDRKDHLQAYMFTGIGPLLHTVDRSHLYGNGSLIKPKVEFVFTDFDYEQASMKNEINSVDAGGEDLDYRDLLDHLIADEARARLIAEKILDNAPGNYSIVITESVRYCYVLRNMVAYLAASRGWSYPRMAVVHGPISRYTTRVCRQNDEGATWNERLQRWEQKVEQYTEDEIEAWRVSNAQRKEIIAACSRKEIDILFATQLAREGLDMPHLSVGHMAMPKKGDTGGGAKNGSSVEQEIGRIMRADPGNPNKVAKWFDYVDYNVGVFKAQYQTRRSVYRRLGIELASKRRVSKADQEALDFLDQMMGGLPH